ncbi:RHS repeat-associated core domain-containing protein, partial [Parazoarcus communis]
PYGEPNVTTGARFRYTGQQYLGELNLYYYKARFYSPALGRFLQTDPIGTADDLNLYAYVGNNPVNFSDPTGLIKAEADRLGAAVGGSTAAQMLVPGQTAWNNMLSNFGMGNYGAAAVNGVTYAGEVALFALTLGGSQAYMASTRAALPAVESLAAKGVDPNKLKHIFGQERHNLSGVAKQFGSEEKAFNAIQQATETAVGSQGLKGVFEMTVKVGTETITVRGNVVDGVVKIGTAFVP